MSAKHDCSSDCSSAKHENDLFGSSWCYCSSAKHENDLFGSSLCYCSSAKHENDLFGSSWWCSSDCCLILALLSHSSIVVSFEHCCLIRALSYDDVRDVV